MLFSAAKSYFEVRTISAYLFVCIQKDCAFGYQTEYLYISFFVNGFVKKSTVFLVLIVLFLIITVLFAVIYVMQTKTPQDKSAIVTSENCGNLAVYVLNVSQADSIFIITPANKTILIDAGSKSTKNSAEQVVAFLKQNNISKIDHVIATHCHEDHIGGMELIFANFEVENVYENGNCGSYDSKTAKRFWAYRSIENFITVKQDMQLDLDNCLSEAMAIVAYDNKNGSWPGHEENDNSILLRLVYANTTFLFTGDCEKECEEALLAQNTNLKADFLKIGHHGSATSSTEPFLDAVDATYFAISVDHKKSASDGYFHPRLSTLEKLYERADNSVFRTDLNGEIKAISNGKAIIVVPETKVGECESFAGYPSWPTAEYSVVPVLKSQCS